MSARQRYDERLTDIYAMTYPNLRRTFSTRAKAQNVKLNQLVPAATRAAFRTVLTDEAAQVYRRDAMLEHYQATAPMRLTIIFNQHTSRFENGRIFVNVPAILQAVENIHPDLLLDLPAIFKNWINTTRLAAIEVPANRVMFIMRRDFSGDGRNPIVWSAWRNENGTFTISPRILPRFHWLDYLSGVSQNLKRIDDPYELVIDFVAPRRDNPEFIQVGYDYAMTPGDKNCLVKILSPFVPQPVANKFEELTGHLIHKLDAPAYVDDAFIDKLGKLLRVKISLYTPYGALHDTPTKVLGAGGNKKNFKLIVANRHATVFAPTIVNKVRYITREDYVADAGNANMSTVIDAPDATIYPELAGTPWEYVTLLDPEKETSTRNISAYITVDDFGRTEAVTTMNKLMRPSAITGILEDDENPALFNKTNPSGVFLYNFIRKNNFTTPPKFVHELASKAGRPFGTAMMCETTDRTRLIEIDQNASYASFEFSKFYTGMPMGNWMKLAGPPMDLPDPELKPAFLEISNIHPKKTNDARFNEMIFNYFEELGRLRQDFSVITYPEYKAWSALAQIDVINTTYATFQRIGIYDDLNELAARMAVQIPDGIVSNYIKQMRNSFTGKLIQGGLDTYGAIKTITTKSREEFEIMIAEHERDFNELPHTEITTVDDEQVYKITTTINKPGHRFPHIYAYITAISRLSVLGMICMLKQQRHTIARVHVDAIYVRVPSKIKPEEFAKTITGHIGTTPGMFKVITTPKKYKQAGKTESAFNVFTGEFNASGFSQARTVDAGYPGHRKVVVTGAGGTGKTHVAVNFLRDGNGASANGRALYLTPTKDLRREMRDKLDEVNKQPSDCVCLESVRRAIIGIREARARGRPAPPEYVGRLSHIAATYTYIIIDEFCKTDGAHLLEIINFAETYRKNIVMLGDFNQTIFSLSGIYATHENLIEWGFHMFADPRNARSVNIPMRHSVEWGTFLDSIAGLDSETQVQRLIDYGVSTTNGENLDASGLVYCGSWGTIAQYNQALLVNDTAVRLASIGKRDVIPYNAALKPQVWNKSAFTEQAPRGKKYTVDFAITVDSVQGSTVENPIQYIHVASLVNRWGAIYTAATRSRTPDQIVLIL